MKPNSTTATQSSSRWSATFNGGILFLLMLTGFAQMPIFKRYYIADIPGLGWLAQFYVTHFLHYLFAAIFVAIATYKTAEYMLEKKQVWKLSPRGYLMVLTLFGLIFTGGLLVIRNLSGIYFPASFIIALDIGHLLLVFGLMAGVAYGLFSKTGWLARR
ncbi:MAG: hypothetical protein HKM93_02795 [Desulfobacteraceae bacterium]|nr:hypothetical protein [Desulfobacteraceae bacterium]